MVSDWVMTPTGPSVSWRTVWVSPIPVGPNETVVSERTLDSMNPSVTRMPRVIVYDAGGTMTDMILNSTGSGLGAAAYWRWLRQPAATSTTTRPRT